MIAYLGLTLLTLAALGVWTAVLLIHAGRLVKPEPSPIFWICDTCGRLARTRAGTKGLLQLQAIRASHHCPARADVAAEVEDFLAHQPPP